MIRKGSYKAAYEDSRCEYEPVSDLCTDIWPDNDSSVDGSSDEWSKYQEKLDDQEQEGV